MALGDFHKPKKPDIEEIKRQFMADAASKLRAESLDLLKNLSPDYIASESNQKGLKFLDEGKYQAALKCFNGAVANKPDDDELWVNRATALYRLKRMDEVAGSVEKALELNPNNARALNLRGVLYETTGEHQKAIEHYQKAVELNPNDPQIQKNLETARKKLQTPLTPTWSQTTPKEPTYTQKTEKPAYTWAPTTRETKQQKVYEGDLKSIKETFFGIITSGIIGETTVYKPYLGYVSEKPYNRLCNIKHSGSCNYSYTKRRYIYESYFDLYDHIHNRLSNILPVNQATIQSFLDFILKDVDLTSPSSADKGISEIAGYCISALINNSTDKTITLVTGKKGRDIRCIGSELSDKYLTIDGDVGGEVGYVMKSGKITIKGNAGDYAGQWTHGGEIIIEGNAGDYIGYYMEGGNITIKGNAGNKTGYEMVGGKITIGGNVRDDTGLDMDHGTIIVEGNAGNDTGRNADYGDITIKGNAGNGTGFNMHTRWGSGAHITIEGNVGDNTGTYMKGGEIIVKGDAGNYTGHWMSDGKILVMGDVGNNTGDCYGGKIIVEGNAGETTGKNVEVRGKVASYGANYPEYYEEMRMVREMEERKSYEEYLRNWEDSGGCD